MPELRDPLCKHKTKSIKLNQDDDEDEHLKIEAKKTFLEMFS